MAATEGDYACPAGDALSDDLEKRMMRQAVLELVNEGEDGTRIVHGRLVGPDAYDTWTCAEQTREALDYRQLTERGDFTVAELPRQEKALILATLLLAMPACRRLTELGSSVMEVIDGLEAGMNLIARTGGPVDAAGRIAPEALEFVGIEPSALMRRLARAIHAGTPIVQYEDVTAALRAGVSGGLLYDRCVTSYAFDDVVEAAAFINRFDAAYMNLLISKEGGFSTPILGRNATYFPLEALNRHLRYPLTHLFGLRAPPRVAYRNQGRPVIEGFFLHAPPETVTAFIALGATIAPLRDFIAQKGLDPRPAIDLIDLTGDTPGDETAKEF